MEEKMKKILTAVASLIAACALMSCGSTNSKVNSGDSAAKQAKEDGYPEWVYVGKQDDTGIYAVGAGKMANLVNSAKMAVAEGRSELARTLKVQVQDVLQTYTSDLGSEQNRDALSGLIDNTLQKTDAVLEGSRQVNRFNASDGTVYVLMYLPYESAVSKLNTVVSDYTGKAEAVITDARMREAYEKYFAGADKKTNTTTPTTTN